MMPPDALRSHPAWTALIAAALLLLVAWLPGCAGGGGVSVGTSLSAEEAELTVLGAEAEAVVSIVEGDAGSDELADRLEAAAADPGELEPLAAPAAAPGWQAAAGSLLPAGLRDEEPTRDRETSLDRFAGDRVSRVTIHERYDGDLRAAARVYIDLTYSSTPEVSGDLNDAPAPERGGREAYVYAAITAVVDFRPTQRGDLEPATVTGFRHWHTDSDVGFLVYDLTTTMPAAAAAPYATRRQRGDFGETAPGVGSVRDEVVFADGRQDVRAWSFTANRRTLRWTYDRTGPDGLEESGEGIRRFNGTPRCRLDDTGRHTVERRFPPAATTAAVPVRETVHVVEAAAGTTESAVLELSDGSERTRNRSAETLSPTDCGEAADGIRVTRVRTTTYGGQTVTAEVTRGRGTLHLTGSRTVAGERPGTVTMTARRAAGLTEVQVIRRTTDGALLAELELSVDPSGRAEGRLRRRPGGRPAAETTAAVERDLRGSLAVGGPSPRRLERDRF